MNKEFNNIRIKNITATTAEWAESTEVLLKGEFGIELLDDGTWKMKIGDGKHTWSDLSYEAAPDLTNYITKESIIIASSTTYDATSGVFNVTIDQKPEKGYIVIFTPDVDSSDTLNNSCDIIFSSDPDTTYNLIDVSGTFADSIISLLPNISFFNQGLPLVVVTNPYNEVLGMSTATCLNFITGLHVHYMSDLLGTLPIANGGTGATTSAAALKNLGITYGTTDLVAGSSELATGAIYLVYE